MSKKLYNAFGELINLNSVETFSSESNKVIGPPTPSCVSSVRKSLRDKYRDWIPRNEREKIAIHSVRLIEEAYKKITLNKEEIEDIRENNLTNNEGKQAKYFKMDLDDATKLVNSDINLAVAYLARKVGFKIDQIYKIGDQLVDAIYARRLGISVQRIMDSLDDETSISGIIKDTKLPKRRLNDGIRLAGNLEMTGSIKADSFFLSDGTQMAEVPKLAFPENVHYHKGKLGINRTNPKTTLDIAGGLGVDNDITCTELLTKKIKSNYNSATVVNSDTQNTLKLNVKNPKTKLNPNGLSTHFNWSNKGENYIRGDTEFRGNTKFAGPYQVTVENPANENNPDGWETHFNWKNKGENHIRGKTEMRGEVNFVGPSRITIENDKTGNNPTGLSTHFNYKNRGENYIRGKTELRGSTDVYGRLCIHDQISKKPICIDSNFVRQLGNITTKQSRIEEKLKLLSDQIKDLNPNLETSETSESSELAMTAYDPDVEIEVNANDNKPRQYRNSKLNEVFGSNSYEVNVTVRVDKNSDLWRNIYHYGNRNSERSPALFIKPKNPWKFQFILRTNKNWNQTYDFDIPNEFRKVGYPLNIRTRVTKEPDNKKITIQNWVNNEYVGQKVVSDAYLAPLYNKDLWIKSPWHNREGYRVEKISFKKIN